jgi:hypothetical protein
MLMRLLLLTTVALVLSSTQQVLAQIKAGTLSTGLNLNMAIINNDQSKSYPTDTYFSLATLPTIESFVGNNFSIIGGVKWGYENRKTVGNQTTNTGIPFSKENQTISNIYSPILGVRKYWFSSNGRFGCFVSPTVQANYMVSIRKETTTDPTVPPELRKQETKRENWSLGATGDFGVCYFILPHLTMELSTPVIKVTVLKKYQSLILNSNLYELSYGIRYYF